MFFHSLLRYLSYIFFIFLSQHLLVGAAFPKCRSLLFINFKSVYFWHEEHFAFLGNHVGKALKFNSLESSRQSKKPVKEYAENWSQSRPHPHPSISSTGNTHPHTPGSTPSPSRPSNPPKSRSESPPASNTKPSGIHQTVLACTSPSWWPILV